MKRFPYLFVPMLLVGWLVYGLSFHLVGVVTVVAAVGAVLVPSWADDD